MKIQKINSTLIISNVMYRRIITYNHSKTDYIEFIDLSNYYVGNKFYTIKVDNDDYDIRIVSRDNIIIIYFTNFKKILDDNKWLIKEVN